jgi:ABC-type nitrate/sulfonate/bicarbonate transport system substrate-binding protein
VKVASRSNLSAPGRRLVRTTHIAIIMVGAFALTACGSPTTTGSSASGSPVVTYIDNTALPMPAGAAMTKGFFAKNNITVQTKKLATGTAAMTAMIGGSADFVIASDSRLLQSVEQKLPIVAIGLAQTGYPSYLAVPASDHTTKSFADLKGKKIGTTVGSAQYVGLIRYLQAEHLDPKSFQFVNIPDANEAAALGSGSISAAVFPNPYAVSAEAKGISRNVITPDKIAAPTGVTFPYLLLTTQQFIDKNANAVQRFVNAWTCAKQYLDGNPTEAKDLLAKALPDYDSTVISGTLAYTSWKQQTIDSGMQTDIAADAKVLADLGVIKGVPDWKKSINNTFVNKALQSGCS